jgi:hypothetical protein
MLITSSLRTLDGILKVASLAFIVSFLGVTGCTDTSTEISGKESALDANQETHINNISIKKLHPDMVELEVDYYYDGSAGNKAKFSVELITADKIGGGTLRTNVAAARKGDHKRIVRIGRPAIEIEKFETEEVKVTFANIKTSEVFFEESMALPVAWKAKPADALMESLDYWAYIAFQSLYTGYYAGLDRAFNEWNDSGLRTVDGKWRLDGLISLFELTGVQGKWESIYSKILEWKKHSPGKPGPAIVESLYWYSYAWHARGGGYANEVSETGWELFNERLAKTEKVLLDSKSYASDNPLWYYQYVRTAAGLGWDKRQLLELFSEAVNKEPAFYQTYFATIGSMSPKWGGSYELMDKVATSSAEFTRETEGDIVYARVYWSIDDYLSPQDNYFEDTLVDWGRMKQGFEQLLAAYPDSKWNLGNFASFACRAGDKETYLRLRKKINLTAIDFRAWKTGYSPDTCDHMFMQKL